MSDADIRITKATVSRKTTQSRLHIPRLSKESIILGEVIGHGGFSRVYRGTLRGAPVAIKQMMTLSGAGVEKMMQNELKLLIRLRHSNFVSQVIGYYHADSILSIVMKLAENGDLHKYLLAGHLVGDWNTKARICADIAKAIDSVHAENIIHGDLKAENILLDRYLTPKLTDFGLSKSFSSLTVGNKVGLTLRYVAPERLLPAYGGTRHSLPESVPGDIYSYGLVMWEVATDGKIPYGDIDDLRIIGAKMDPGDPLVYIGNLPGDVPQVFRELIGNYLQWKPLLRPPLRLAQEALDAYIDAHPTSMVFHSSPLPNQIAIATSLITGSDSNSAVAELFRGYDFLTDAEINLLSESQQDFFRGGLYHIRRQRYLKAVSYFQQSEFAQQPLTQRLLGLCHQLMDDDVGAFMCFKRSAVSDGKGKFLLAWCFDHEYGTERDEEAAFIWYKSSAAQGVIEAATTLRDSRWIKYMNDALDQDFDGLALGWLGNIFKPEALYYEVFVENIHDAAESGNSDARYFLVWANSLRVIIKNNCEAFRNYMDADLCLRLIHAAISGNKFAQNEIQQSLFPMDTSMMPKLDPGQHALVEVLEKLTFPTESDPTPLFPPGLRRVSRSKKSKRSFFAAGQLARCYQLGIGVSQDFSKALDLYRMAAAAGDTYAQWQIGNCYYHGIGIEKDVIEAFRWIYKAAHAGLVLAWCDLGDMYAQGVGTKRDDEKAFAYYLRAAQAGKINAIRSVGFCYLNGQGVGRKLNEWFLWISLAAHAGDAQAMCNVGNCYANGNEGVEKNNVEAFRWFSKAARLGNTHAMHNMGLCYLNGIGVEKNENEGFQWVFKATEAGLSEAQYNLGICYAKGKGITQDSKKAFQCFVKATNAGVIEARYNLGLCYEIGDGTGKNYGKAFQCFFKAAKAGKREAMHSLGVCYQDGRGIDKDENEAFWWFSKASEAGLAEADCSLGVCYEKGKGTNKDYYMAFDYYFKATQAEDLTAMHCLGNCYFNGKGVTKDELEAFQWFLKAAEAGFSPSQGMVGNCYWSGIGVEENKSIANEWYLKSAYGGDAHAMFCIADSYENGTGVQKDLVEARRWYMESAQKGDEEAKSALMRFDLQHFALFPT